MKTWTNPTVEELEVKMTANGGSSTEYEDTGDIIGGIVDSMGGDGDAANDWVDTIIPDLPIINDGGKKDDEKEQS